MEIRLAVDFFIYCQHYRAMTLGGSLEGLTAVPAAARPPGGDALAGRRRPSANSGALLHQQRARGRQWRRPGALVGCGADA